MKPILLLTLLSAFAFATPVQDGEIADLVKKLSGGDFAEQGKAAAALERMGRAAVPELQKLQKDSGDARVRTWCGWILEKIEARDGEFKELIEKLASRDDEVKEAAERELRRIGDPAIPYLREQLKSEDKNLRRRAEKLIGDIERGGPLARAGGRERAPAALIWLARHQNPDGSWSARDFGDRCAKGKCAGKGEADYDAGVTGLALLAFLAAEFTPLTKEEFPDPVTPGRALKFDEVVNAGLKWILSHQDPEGAIGGRGTKYMYNHAVAAWALVEAYARTSNEKLRAPAQQAVDFLVASQNPGKGWRYSKQSGDNDTSVTGWAVLALTAADRAKLTVPAAAYEGARAWLDEVTDPTIFFRTGYNGKNSGKVFVPGKNEHFTHHETMTAISVSSRLLMFKDRKDPALGGVALLTKDLPQWRANEVDGYFWFHATAAIYHYDAPDGPFWKKWKAPLMATLTSSQKTEKDGCAAGSWDSEADRWGFEGGRVYMVALNSLSLSIAHTGAPFK